MKLAVVATFKYQRHLLYDWIWHYLCQGSLTSIWCTLKPNQLTTTIEFEGLYPMHLNVKSFTAPLSLTYLGI